MKNLKANFTKTISRIEEQLIPGLSSRFGSQSAVTKVRPSYIIQGSAKYPEFNC